MTTQDELQQIQQDLAHDFIRVRTAAIERARSRLQAGQGIEELLPQLRRMAEADPIRNVRQAAQAVVDEWQQAQWAALPGAPADLEHRFPLRCPDCGHVTWFDKRRVCGQEGSLKRETVFRNGRTLARLTLACECCGAEMVHEADCEGYR